MAGSNSPAFLKMASGGRHPAPSYEAYSAEQRFTTDVVGALFMLLLHVVYTAQGVSRPVGSAPGCEAQRTAGTLLPSFPCGAGIAKQAVHVLRHGPWYVLARPARLRDWGWLALAVDYVAVAGLLLALVAQPRSGRLWRLWRRHRNTVLLLHAPLARTLFHCASYASLPRARWSSSPFALYTLAVATRPLRDALFTGSYGSMLTLAAVAAYLGIPLAMSFLSERHLRAGYARVRAAAAAGGGGPQRESAAGGGRPAGSGAGAVEASSCADQTPRCGAPHPRVSKQWGESEPAQWGESDGSKCGGEETAGGATSPSSSASSVAALASAVAADGAPIASASAGDAAEATCDATAGGATHQQLGVSYLRGPYGAASAAAATAPAATSTALTAPRAGFGSSRLLSYRGLTHVRAASVKVLQHPGSFEEYGSRLLASAPAIMELVAPPTSTGTAHRPTGRRPLPASAAGAAAAAVRAVAVRGCVQLITWRREFTGGTRQAATSSSDGGDALLAAVGAMLPATEGISGLAVQAAVGSGFDEAGSGAGGMGSGGRGPAGAAEVWEAGQQLGVQLLGVSPPVLALPPAPPLKTAEEELVCAGESPVRILLHSPRAQTARLLLLRDGGGGIGSAGGVTAADCSCGGGGCSAGCVLLGEFGVELLEGLQELELRPTARQVYALLAAPEPLLLALVPPAHAPADGDGYRDGDGDGAAVVDGGDSDGGGGHSPRFKSGSGGGALGSAAPHGRTPPSPPSPPLVHFMAPLLLLPAQAAAELCVLWDQISSAAAAAADGPPAMAVMREGGPAAEDRDGPAAEPAEAQPHSIQATAVLGCRQPTLPASSGVQENAQSQGAQSQLPSSPPPPHYAGWCEEYAPLLQDLAFVLEAAVAAEGEEEVWRRRRDGGGVRHQDGAAAAAAAAAADAAMEVVAALLAYLEAVDMTATAALVRASAATIARVAAVGAAPDGAGGGTAGSNGGSGSGGAAGRSELVVPRTAGVTSMLRGLATAASTAVARGNAAFLKRSAVPAAVARAGRLLCRAPLRLLVTGAVQPKAVAAAAPPLPPNASADPAPSAACGTGCDPLGLSGPWPPALERRYCAWRATRLACAAPYAMAVTAQAFLLAILRSALERCPAAPFFAAYLVLLWAADNVPFAALMHRLRHPDSRRRRRRRRWLPSGHGPSPLTCEDGASGDGGCSSESQPPPSASPSPPASASETVPARLRSRGPDASAALAAYNAYEAYEAAAALAAPLLSIAVQLALRAGLLATNRSLHHNARTTAVVALHRIVLSSVQPVDWLAWLGSARVRVRFHPRPLVTGLGLGLVLAVATAADGLALGSVNPGWGWGRTAAAAVAVRSAAVAVAVVLECLARWQFGCERRRGAEPPFGGRCGCGGPAHDGARVKVA
ncbi:hypothetical protein GPECTOR_43g942 [Gonium pectorale]|uniref:Uncharacterized protein n=1 Tax=Gonium pectorale TaxID=33097 RepID=A0A150GAA9_GONPE|nr:hypothetical protein GPECTOR_43g942 [Gonium pectorale]|eukprot:KXZ46505.1 hypothetical protein GPECTOR_43g942 [Gonium pectorale]